MLRPSGANSIHEFHEHYFVRLPDDRVILKYFHQMHIICNIIYIIKRPEKYHKSNVGHDIDRSVPVVLDAALMSARLQLVVYAK